MSIQEIYIEIVEKFDLDKFIYRNFDFSYNDGNYRYEIYSNQGFIYIGKKLIGIDDWIEHHSFGYLYDTTNKVFQIFQFLENHEKNILSYRKNLGIFNDRILEKEYYKKYNKSFEELDLETQTLLKLKH